MDKTSLSYSNMDYYLFYFEIKSSKYFILFMGVSNLYGVKKYYI